MRIRQALKIFKRLVKRPNRHFGKMRYKIRTICLSFHFVHKEFDKKKKKRLPAVGEGGGSGTSPSLLRKESE